MTLEHVIQELETHSFGQSSFTPWATTESPFVQQIRQNVWTINLMARMNPLYTELFVGDEAQRAVDIITAIIKGDRTTLNDLTTIEDIYPECEVLEASARNAGFQLPESAKKTIQRAYLAHANNVVKKASSKLRYSIADFFMDDHVWHSLQEAELILPEASKYFELGGTPKSVAQLAEPLYGRVITALVKRIKYLTAPPKNTLTNGNPNSRLWDLSNVYRHITIAAKNGIEAGPESSALKLAIKNSYEQTLSKALEEGQELIEAKKRLTLTRLERVVTVLETAKSDFGKEPLSGLISSELLERSVRLHAQLKPHYNKAAQEKGYLIR